MTATVASMTTLRRLARLYGVETPYKDGLGRRREPEAGALLAVLRSLGAQIDSPEAAPAAIRERREAAASAALEPVIVAWDGVADFSPRVPSSRSATVDCSIALEDGTTRERRVQTAGDPLPLAWPEPLPYGYHRLIVDDGTATHGSLIISAPRRAYRPPVPTRDWGLFAPLYAIHSSRSWGIGDFTDLRRLLGWTSSLGGAVVATLPLLAAFTGGLAAVSPYSPASRLFWNELFIDVPAVPELARRPAAREIVASPEFKAELEALCSSSIVDYEGVAALKRRVLQPLADSIFEDRSPRGDAFRALLNEDPGLAAYARFRAACERHRTGWRAWPAAQRDGTLDERELDAAAVRYHAYAQWIACEQMRALSDEASEKRTSLYLDMPLGVHPDGYDTWSERQSFANGVTAGAPPDMVFTGGQNWGFPPLHPQGARESGYRYLIASLRHVMRHASVLRIDHVAGLHRLFWIPAGMDSSDGVYVHYPAGELYAVLSLESHRNRTVLVGEDLGTIPDYVRPAMADHGVLRSYVLEYELAGGALPFTPDDRFVASLNTHDMEPFAAFWQSNRGSPPRSALIDRLSHECLIDSDEPSLPDAQDAAIAWLAASDAPAVLINLEDLWHETERQNLPGTTEDERPNWRRRARHSLEEIAGLPAVARALTAVAAARRGDTAAT